MDNNNENYERMSPVAAGITGFILGVVGTAAVAMSDKDTRTKVTKKASEMKDKMEKWSKDTLHDLHAAGEEAKKKSASASEKLSSDKTSGVNAADEAKQRLEDALSENK